MAAQNNAKVAAAQLELVRKKLPILFERDDYFYANMAKRPGEVISSRDMRIPLELRPGGKFGQFDSDGGSLGRGSGTTYDKAVINTIPFKIGIEWTKKAEWATRTGRQAVINSVNKEMASAMKEFRRQIDSQLQTAGDGVLGTISNVSTGSGVDTITLGTDGFGAKLLRYNQNVNIYDSGLTTRRTSDDGNEITFIDYANNIIKIAAVSGIDVGDKVVIAGVSATPPVSIYGVPYHHSDASTGSWLGLDRATNPEVRSNSVDASSGALALPFARQLMNKIGDRVGLESNVKATAWMHPCQAQAYEELGQLISIINKDAGAKGLDLYFNDNMQLAGVPTKKHFLWDKTRIDFIVNDVWGRAEMLPIDFYDVEGRRIFEIRGSDGGVATAQIFYLCVVMNAYVDNPASTGYIKSLAKPAGY